MLKQVYLDTKIFNKAMSIANSFNQENYRQNIEIGVSQQKIDNINCCEISFTWRIGEGRSK